MRNVWLFLFLILTALTFSHRASADQVFVVLEQDARGNLTQEALDLSLSVDDVDPVLLHVFFNSPTDPNVAQLLWASKDAPAEWELGGDNEDYQFIEHGVLPAGSKIEYRIFTFPGAIELGNFRHTRTSEDWKIKESSIDALFPGEYRVSATLSVPGRPTIQLFQRLTVKNNPDNTPPATAPEPAPTNPGNGNNPDPDEEEPQLDLGGFTTLPKATETRIIYVSSSRGNDNNSGRTESKAVKTLDRGASLLRDGRADWLLLKAGDTWDGESFDGFNKAGGGVNKPMVVGVYGEGKRPLIIPPKGESGFRATKDKIDGLIIQGLHFYAATRDPGSLRFVGRGDEVDGISVRLGGNDGKYAKGLIIEDCKITHFDTNIEIVDDWARMQLDANNQPIEGKPGRIKCLVRRNIVRYAQGSDTHSVGIYIEGTYDSIIEQNLIDHNGWAQTDGFEHRNQRSHNIYAQRFNGPIIVRHNIIARGGAHGLQLRAGGEILNNLFVRNALAFYASINDSKANYNVVLESDDLDPDVPGDWRGMGIMGWGMNSYQVIGNLVAGRVGTLQRPGIDVSAKNLTITGNTIYNWYDRNNKTSITYSSNNPVVNFNRTPELNGGEDPDYIAPDRSLATYARSIGLQATNKAFLDAASNRARGTWPEKFVPNVVCEYIRAGFVIR